MPRKGSSNLRVASEGPKQDRSRITVARILDACNQILEERGHEDFTLQDISSRANVSIGTIYGHFVSKEELLRAVQLRVVKQISFEHSEAMGTFHAMTHTLKTIVPPLVEELGELHSRHAPILRALMVRAWQDETMSKMGKRTDAQLAASFRSLLLECRAEIPHPDPVLAIDHCFDTIYAAILRFQGLGTAPNVHGRGNWHQYLKYLGNMTMQFLSTAPE